MSKYVLVKLLAERQTLLPERDHHLPCYSSSRNVKFESARIAPP